MHDAELRTVAQDNRLTALFKDGIDYIRAHHILAGKPGFRLPAIDANKRFAEVDLLNKLPRERTDHTFAALLVDSTEQNDLPGRLFKQMRNIAADGDDGNIAALGKRTGEKGVATAVFDKYRLTGVDQLCGARSQFTFDREMGHHTGFDIFAIQRYGETMSPAQIALLFQ